MEKGKFKLLIIGSSQGNYGGIEAYMIALAEAASFWPEFEVRLCFKLVKNALPSEVLIKMAEDVCSHVQFVQRGSKQLAQSIFWANILHIQNTPPDVIFLARIFAKKVFLTVHNRRVKRTSLHNFIWGISMEFAHHRWYNSNFVWSTWEPQKKSDKSECVPTVCRLPNAWCPPEDRKGFLFIGRWIENKGIEELIKAYAHGRFDTKEWPLTILGDGPLKHKVHALLEELNLNEVQTPGFVDDETKAKYLSNTRWVLAPARTQEDLGLTPIEARSVGVPSIVTRDGGLPESGGPAALIAEPADIDDLLRCMQIAVKMDKDEYSKRGMIAQESLNNFLKPIDFYRKAYRA